MTEGPHLNPALSWIRQIDTLEVIHAMRMCRIRDCRAMRTRHHNRTRIRIGDGHSIDDELFAAAIAAKMTSPYSRHITLIYEFRSKISIRCLPGECVPGGFD